MVNFIRNSSYIHSRPVIRLVLIQHCRDLGRGKAHGNVKISRTPGKTVRGTVPDVEHLGLRQALVKLEKAGYNVAFNGQGSVVSQTPAAGSPAPKGSKVTLTLSQKAPGR